MLALERHRRLLQFLNQNGSVRTTELAKELNVTEETIRRDFEKLEKEGSLLRAHGGAVRLDIQRREMPVRDRAGQNAPEKRQIAREALPLIEAGQTIFMDPSTTVQQLARLIPDQPLTILTSSLKIPLLFVDKPSVQVILLGGVFRPSSLSCVGYAAEMSADLFRIDAAFISCRGIDPVHGLSEATEDQARLKRYIIGRAASLYLLADGTKAEVTSSHFFARNSDVDIWITDHPPEVALASALQTQGVRIIVACA
jgi:DeoR/GlpR family transcriptional regulator of sugar metabolism